MIRFLQNPVLQEGTLVAKYESDLDRRNFINPRYSTSENRRRAARIPGVGSGTPERNGIGMSISGVIPFI